MKIAVTFGENNTVFQHFGHTERFKLYTVEGGKVVSSEVVDTAGAGHEALAVFLANHGVDTLVCGGIGPGAVNALGMCGIRVFGGNSGDADAAVAALLNGTLEYNPNPNCDHHDGEHGHHCEHHGDSHCGC